MVAERRVPVVSFTFGCPTAEDVDRLQSAGSAVCVTVTTVAEARAAYAVGADALVLQGVEAGGHRGGFDDARPGDLPLLPLLQLVRDAVGPSVELVATEVHRERLADPAVETGLMFTGRTAQGRRPTSG